MRQWCDNTFAGSGVDNVVLKPVGSAKPDPAIVSNTDSIGLAQLQAARGLLIHRLELRHGRVYDYRIAAPTEWNLHPEGVVAQGLKHLKAESPNDLRRQAELLINSVDPCVLYNLKLTDSHA